MANLFEKPIAANPMSEFVGLPMDFIDQALQRRQDKYDRAKAEIEEQENSLLNLKYLPGDAKRHHELQAQYEKELDSMVENTGGDYSTIGASLDLFTRRLKRDIGFGELGSQQNNYTSAMKFREDVDKRLLEGKASDEGYEMALQSIMQHKTTPTEQGTFSTFTGYTPSSIVNPLQMYQDSADEIHAKWDADGQQYVSPDLIERNLLALTHTNSGLVKAMREKFRGDPNDPNYEQNFAQFQAKIISDVVSDKEYQQIKNATEGGNKAVMSALVKDIAQPRDRQGNLTYSGGSSPWFKNLTAWAGANSWKESNDWISSSEGKRVIRNIELATGTKMPQDTSKASEWILKNSSQEENSIIATRGPSSVERNILNDTGQLQIPNIAIRDAQTGELLEGDEIQTRLGSTKDANNVVKQPFVSGVITSGKGHVPGSVLITAADGSMLIAEPFDKTLLMSKEYNLDLLQSASNYNTGETSVTLLGQVGIIPPDTYDVKFNRENGEYKIFRGNTLMYTTKLNPANGLMNIFDHTKTEE